MQQKSYTLTITAITPNFIRPKEQVLTGLVVPTTIIPDVNFIISTEVLITSRVPNTGAISYRTVDVTTLITCSFVLGHVGVIVARVVSYDGIDFSAGREADAGRVADAG